MYSDAGGQAYANGFFWIDGNELSGQFELLPVGKPAEKPRKGRPKSDSRVVALYLAMEAMTQDGLSEAKARQRIIEEWHWYSCERAVIRAEDMDRVKSVLGKDKAMNLIGNMSDPDPDTGRRRYLGMWIDPSRRYRIDGDSSVVTVPIWFWIEGEREAEYFELRDIRFSKTRAVMSMFSYEPDS